MSQSTGMSMLPDRRNSPSFASATVPTLAFNARSPFTLPQTSFMNSSAEMFWVCGLNVALTKVKRVDLWACWFPMRSKGGMATTSEAATWRTQNLCEIKQGEGFCCGRGYGNGRRDMVVIEKPGVVGVRCLGRYRNSVNEQVAVLVEKKPEIESGERCRYSRSLVRIATEGGIQGWE
ncbi:hypothetical protein BJ165DRAFT_1517233 [Panaeolus papilionaceus]|nr:hypothetical protein BJ165DRAFT_1517233 [Panaeolus papilionaceus]